MTLKEQLIHEIETAPEPVLEEVFNFLMLAKLKHHQAQAQPSPSSAPQSNPLQNFLEQVQTLQAQIPPHEWDKLPHDGSINHDHYLYGSPKIEE